MEEKDVWDIIKRYSIRVHPCYYLGYSRCSCKWCIFGNNDQMATSYFLSPYQGNSLARYETQFSKTIKKGVTLIDFIKKGNPFDAVFQFPDIAIQAISQEYWLPIFTDNWILPAGAFKKGTGPS